MSTMRVTTLKNESSTVDQIVLNADGSFGGELASTLGSKLPYSFGTATPSSPGDGEIWVDTSGSPNKPSVKFYDGATFQPVAGLTLITSESFSAVSSVSVNNCFTSSYATYKLLITGTGSATISGGLRLRASGSDNSTNDHVQQKLEASSTTVGGARDTLTSFLAFTFRSGNPAGFSHIILGNPHAAATKTFMANVLDPVSGAALEFRYGSKNVTTQFDGFSLIASGGTMTGTVRVYGYKD